MFRLTGARLGQLLVLTAMMSALVACSAPTAPSIKEPPLGVIQVITDPRQIVLPLDAYELNPQDAVLVERAEHELAGVCMRRFGFTWEEQFNERNLPSAITHYRLYGLLNEASAAAYGYHNGPLPPGPDYVDPATEDSGDVSLDFWNVLGAKTGGGTYRGMQIPEGGCFGEARRKVAEGGPAFDPALPENLSIDSWARSNKDGRVLAAFGAWSACMAEAGFSYRTPMDANNDGRWHGDKGTRAEIAVATADVRCKKQTNLTGIRMAVDSAYQQRAIETGAQALDAVKKGHERQLRNAPQILAAR